MRLVLLIAVMSLLATRDMYAQTDTGFTYQKPLFDFDYKKPVFKLEGEQMSNQNKNLRFSVLTGYRAGIKPVNGIVNFAGYTDPANGTRRLYMYNLSIVEMLTHGFPNFVILEVKDPSRYMYKPEYGNREQWYHKNGYCFELCMPVSIISYELLNQELAAVLGVKFGFEKRIATAENRYGLDPKEGNKEVDVLVIKENR